VFAKYKDNAVIIEGENRKEYEHIIPTTKIDRYEGNEVQLIFQKVL